MIQQRKLNSIPVLSYFHTLHLTFRQCAGGGDGQHFDLTTKPKESFYWALNSDASGSIFTAYKGKVAEWFRQQISSNPVPVQTTCWRCSGGKGTCNGAASFANIKLSIPIILIIEVGVLIHENNATQEDISQWEYPQTLLPDTNSAAKEDGLIYDIVGRAFTNGGHFIARYTSNSRIFNYNGMQHDGFSQRDKKAKVSTHICGSDVPRPSGYHTNSVVYHLRGGAVAQQRFYRDRIHAIQRIHQISIYPLDISSPAKVSFTKPGTLPMPDRDRYWLKNPYKSTLTEYIQSGIVPPTTTALEKLDKEIFGHDPKDSKAMVSADGLENNLAIPLPQTQSNAVRKRVRFWQTILSDSEDSAVADKSDFEFSCRCGARGDGHSLSNGENCVQCEACEKWSHVACQRGQVNPKESFVCGDCGGISFQPLTVAKRQENFLHQ